jgi:hypothetical protein
MLFPKQIETSWQIPNSKWAHARLIEISEVKSKLSKICIHSLFDELMVLMLRAKPAEESSQSSHVSVFCMTAETNAETLLISSCQPKFTTPLPLHPRLKL